MMLFAQSFSLHAHIDVGDDHHQSHAHSHVINDTHDDHLNSEHNNEDDTETLGTIAKKAHLIDLCIFILLAIISTFLFKLNTWHPANNNQRTRYLLFFRPPLRAPPL